MASAQLKTAILLAGVYANGETTVIEPSPSRNHTELMLPEYGITTTAGARTASVTGPNILQSAEVGVPGDPSSAAYLVAGAVLKKGSTIQVENVSLNTARIGFMRTLERMNASVSMRRTGSEGKEPIGILEASYVSELRGCEIPADKIPTIVDEVPVLSLVAAFGRGVTVFREVGELRVKETDRLAATVEGLAQLGVDAWIDGNDLFIEGQPGLVVPENMVFDSKNDHRLAMTWALVGLTGKVPVKVANFDSVKISYPKFLHDFERLTQ
jgi:3-phosphoshikimate 1-carboxyvinyltransferase